MPDRIIVTDHVPMSERPKHRVKAKAVNLLVIRCSNLQNSLEFYRGIGLLFSQCFVDDIEEHGAIVPGPGVCLTADEPGADMPNTAFNLMPAGKSPVTTGLSFGFFVDSVDKAIENCLNNGGQILSEAADWPYGRKAAIQDPDGNRIELSEDPGGRLTGDYA